MIINFRQGISSYDTSIPPFTAAVSVGGVDVTLNVGTQPFVVSVANQVSNYLWSESLTVTAWPSLSSVGTYWLYIDWNTKTFERTFGTSILVPIVQNTAPVSPANDQHWYQTSTSQMYFWNGAAWNPVIRLFVAKFIGPSSFLSLSINAPSFQGTTVGDTTSNVSAGMVIFDSSGYPIFKHDGTFFTTEDQVFAEGSAITGVRLESNVFTAQSASPSIIPVYTAVGFNQNGQIYVAEYNDAGVTAIGFTLQQINFSGTGAVLLEGTVTNPLWDYTGQVGSLLWISGNIPGTLQSTDPHLVNPVTYPIARVPVARVISPTSIIFLQGIGTKGDPGPSGSAGISLATPITPGSVLLSTNGGTQPTPTPIVVSEVDLRLINARTPLAHNQAATTITIAPFGAITGPTVQSALQQLDLGKLNLSGGTLTGSLILNADPTLALGAATKQYVDAATANAGANLYSPSTGGLILTLDGVNRSIAANAKLFLLLKSGGGLTQDTNGLYIPTAGITNSLLANPSIPVDTDGVGSTTMTLGSTFNVFGSANRIITSASPSTVTVDLAPAGTAGTYTNVTTDAYGRVISGTNTATAGSNYDFITGITGTTVSLINVTATGMGAGKVYIQVFLNGVLQRESGNFVVTNPSLLTFASSLISTDEVTVFQI